VLSTDSGISSTGSIIDTAAFTEYSISSFLDTSTNQGGSITTEDTGRVYIVLLLFGGLWAVGLFLVFVNLNQKAFEKTEMKKVQPEQNAVIQPEIFGKRKLAVGNIHAKRDSTKEAIAELKEYLTKYIRELFPSVFIHGATFRKFIWEIMSNHLYLRPFSKKTDMGAKSVEIFRIVTNQSFLIFSVSLLCTLRSPADDGVCSSFTTSDECNASKALFHSTGSTCQWRHGTNNDIYQCYYHEIEITYLMLLYFVVLISGINSGFGWLLDQIFEVICAPLSIREGAGAKVQPEVPTDSDVLQSNLKKFIKQDSLQIVKQSMKTRKIVNRNRKSHSDAATAISFGRKNMRRNVGESVFTVPDGGLDAYRRIMKRVEFLKGISSSLESHKERMKINQLHQIIEKTGGARDSDADDDTEVKSDDVGDSTYGDKENGVREPTFLSLLSGTSLTPVRPAPLRSQKAIRRTYEDLQFRELRDNITVQRSMLSNDDLAIFDDMWCLGTDGNVSEST